MSGTSDQDYLQAIHRATQKIKQLKEENAALKQGSARMPTELAIIGMGCRFPGEAQDLDSFWRVLSEGIDTISEIPAERWNLNQHFDTNSDTPGKSYAKHGAFLEGIDKFDADFFRISPKEAKAMDPQQRILLEVCWQAFEHAGLTQEALKGSRTGTYIGISTCDYSQNHLTSGDLTQINSYSLSGVSHSTCAGRISYLFDLHGPCLAIDTACSSSLAAMHLAIQSLRNNEIDMAIVGGVNIITRPELYVGFSKIHALSVDGKCKAFDDAANGYVRGEGCGVIILARENFAREHQHPVLAKIKGSAINQDGETNGLTAPNAVSQRELLKAALKDAQIADTDIDYIEAHGTGTPLGDPIEIRALNEVYGARDKNVSPLLIGSLKTNIGHTEAAAGVASVIKTVLALMHKKIPPSLHFSRPSSQVDWSETHVDVNTTLRDWPVRNTPHRAGISSFGFSGTNVHVIIEEAANPDATPTETQPNAANILLSLSAKNNASLQHLAKNYLGYLAENPAVGLGGSLHLESLCKRAALQRTHFNYRMAACGHNLDSLREDLQRQLDDAAAASSKNTAQKNIAHHKNNLVFLFTGQGSQYLGMGKEAYFHYREFRSTFEQCANVAAQYLAGDSIIELLFADLPASAAAEKSLEQLQQKLNLPLYTQLSLFCLEYSLARLWMFWVGAPAAVMGHSLGEYVAATIAGVFSLEDAIKLVATRARLMGQLPMGQSGMISILADQQRVQDEIDRFGEAGLTIAGLNAPASTVVAGELALLKDFSLHLDRVSINSIAMNVSHGFHSPHMNGILDEFKQVARTVDYRQHRIPLVSNISGTWVDDKQLLDADYWAQHTLAPVNFRGGINSLLTLGHLRFIEIGPKPTLIQLARLCVAARPAEQVDGEIDWLTSLKLGSSDLQQLKQALSCLYCRGVNIQWDKYFSNTPMGVAPLPDYPFNRQSYWQKSDINNLTNSLTNAHNFADSERHSANPIIAETNTFDNSTITNGLMNPEGSKAMASHVNAVSREAQFKTIIAQIIGKALEKSVGDIDPSLSFMEMGADSIIIVEALREVEELFNITISVRQIFEELTDINSLAAYIDSRVAPDWKHGVSDAAILVNPDTSSPEKYSAPVAVNAVNHAPLLAQTQPFVPAQYPAAPVNLQPLPTPHHALNPALQDNLFTQQLHVVSQAMNLIAQQLHSLQGTVPANNQGIAQYTNPAPVAPAVAEKPYQVNAEPVQALSVAKNKVAAAKDKLGSQFYGKASTNTSGWDSEQAAYFEQFSAAYIAKTKTSKALAATDRQTLADSRAAIGFRLSIKEMLYLIVSDRAKGTRLWDVDGNEYLDVTMGFGVYLFGNNPDFITRVLQKNIDSMEVIGPRSHLVGKVSALMAELTGLDRCTFCNSGTEAVMAAIRLARSATKKIKIVVFDGSYHGHSDYTLAKKDKHSPYGLPLADGTPKGVAENIIVLEYGNPDSINIIRQHAHELAAVLVEPVQSRNPALQPREFLQELRRVTHDTNICLIFDEMITGFRIHQGGAQAWFGVKADMATYGKTIAGGLPIGVVAGSAKYMDGIDGGAWSYGDNSYPETERVFFGGTFNQHPLAMMGAYETLQYLKQQGPELQERLNRLTNSLVSRLNNYFTAVDFPLRTVNFGSLFRFEFTQNMELFFYHLLQNGIFIWEWRSGFISTAHTENDIEFILTAVKKSVEQLRAGGFYRSAKAPLPLEQFSALAIDSLALEKKLVQDSVLLSESQDLTDYLQAAELLNELALDYAVNALQALGLPFTLHQTYAVRDIAASLAIGAEQLPMLERLLGLLASAGYLYKNETYWRVVKDPLLILQRFPDRQARIDFLTSHFPDLTSELALLVRAGENLTAVLMGQNSPLQSLIYKEKENPLIHFYRNSPVLKHMNLLVGAACSSVIAAAGTTNSLRFLEIGGGTAATTSYIIPMLRQRLEEDRAHYTFTDISPKFLVDAKQRFSDVSNIDYRLLNIEKPDDVAAFTPHSFDVVVAVNVLHATKDIRESVRHIASLLKPGGVLLLTEGTRPVLWIDLVFGLTDGWWCFTDADLRDGHPLISVAQWKKVLAEEGFANAFAVATPATASDLPQALIVARRNEKSGTSPSGPKHDSDSSSDSYPLSEAQQQLLLLCKFNEDASRAYNISLSLDLDGELNQPALKRAVNTLVQRHDSLRTIFPEDAEGNCLHQQVLGNCDADIAFIDFRIQYARDAATYHDWYEHYSSESFDVVRGPLFKVRVVQLTDQHYQLILSAHHLIIDGISLGILLQELAQEYQHNNAGQPGSSLVQKPAQYRDFIQWQSSSLNNGTLDAQRNYWKDKVAGFHEPLELPFDRRRGVIKSYQGSRLSLVVSSEVRSRCFTAAAQCGVTPFMFLFGVYTVLLRRFASNQEYIIGVPCAGRSFKGSENIVGYLTHLLPILVDFEEPEQLTTADAIKATAFKSHLHRVRRLLADAFDHQDYPFASLLKELAPNKDLAAFPLVQTTFNLDRSEGIPRFSPELSAVYASQPVSRVLVDFGINIIDTNKDLVIDVDYNTGLFDAATINRIGNCFVSLLDEFSRDANQSLFSVPVLPAADRDEVLFRWGRSVVNSDFQSRNNLQPTIQETVAAQVARFPNNIAVSFQGQSLTYAELNEQANRVAHGLLAQSLVPGSCVAVYLPRSIEMVVALLAILKTGCAYVPLDENLPLGLINYTLTDARIKFLLTNQTLLANQLKEQGKLVLEQPLALLTIDDLLAAPLTAETCIDPLIAAKPEDLAYIIYTSGSTGKPKGVMVEQRNLMSLFLSTERFFQFDEHDVWTQFHSYAFDFSVWEIWGALMFGGRLVLVPSMTCKSPEHFYQLLHDEGVTRLNQTPSAFRQLVNYQAGLDRPLPLALKTVIFGGEALDMGSLKPWVERYGDQSPQLVNMYGITETTVHVTYRRVLQQDVYTSAGASLIGQAIPGLEIYLLDKYLQPVPVGVPGEIYVGGPGVTRGYINREALTQERFIVSPFDPSGQTRLYRSADLGRYLPNGDLEYRGRIDTQVKIRGFRIELGEVEAALRQHPEIEDAAVLAQVSPQQSAAEATTTALLFADQRLVAYVKCNADYENSGALRLDSVALKRFLEARLPGHMIPAAFVAVPEIPMTKNGKVDKRKLAERTAPLFARVDADYVAPSSAIEQALAIIWCKNLGLSRVSAKDNFFDLGGDSISSIKVLSAARREGLHISLEQLYYAPTIAELAAQLVNVNPQHNESITRDKTPFALLRDNDRYNLSTSDDYFRIEDAYPLTALQKGMIFHSERNPHSSTYHDVLSLDITMELRVSLLQEAIAQLVQQHAVLRTAFDLSGSSEPLQMVYKTLSTNSHAVVTDHRNLTQAQQQTLFDNWFKQELETAFAWDSAPLIRFYIHQWDSARFSLTLSFHHSILDGWSVSLLVSELLENYSNALLGRPRDIQPAANKGQVSFRDFVALERHSVTDESTRAYWKNLLEDATFSPFTLPAFQDENPAASATVSESLIHSLKTSLSPDLCSNIAALAKRLGVPVKSILLSAHIKVLSVVGGQQDVISGLVSNGRPIENGADRLLGLFLNTLPLRVFLNNELSNEPGEQDLAIPQGCSWQNLVKQVFQAENAMRPHRYYPLSQLIKDNGGLTLFEVAFNFVNFESYAQLKQAKNFTINDYRFYEETNFPLVVQFEQDSHSGIFNQEFIYSTQRFSPAQIQMLDGYYQRVLEAMTSNWNEPHARHCFLPASEQQKLLLQWNNTAVDYGQCLALHQLFEQQARRTPDAIALQFADTGSDLGLTYNQLNIKANQLAHDLIARGVQAGQPVALCCQRSPEMVIALFAILKAGGCYLPLDSAMPAERLAFILQDSGVSLVLVDKPYNTLGNSAHYQLINVHNTLHEVSHSSTADTKATVLNPDLFVDPKQAAYIIYTSGSTGTPKGVINCHDGIYNRLRWMQDAMALDSNDRVLQKTPYTFDVSVWEFFWTLATGACLVIAKPEGHKDPYYLWSVIKDYGVTTLHFVPPMLQIFLKSLPDVQAFNLRQVICSGETLPSELQNLFFQTLPDVTLFNLYGPTEAAIDVTYWKAETQQGESDVPIGYPIANTCIYILDPWGQPVPTGVVGEIVIGGINVARGYLNRPELNREKFLHDYLVTDKTGQLFRTGDLARFGDDGRIHFLGRKDYQVKIRGMRIELSDVEAAINSAPQVEQSVVIVRDYQGQNSLLAYIVIASAANSASSSNNATTKNNDVVIAQLKNYLATKLPDYMIPAAFVVMDELPLTENGKVNRKSLPLAHSLVVGRSGNYVAPQSPNEKILVELWERTLGIQPVGVEDNFFSLGGDSILSIQVVSKARAQGITISLEQLYQHPSIRELLTLASGEAKEMASGLDAFALISAADRSKLPDNVIDAYPLAELQSGMLFHSQLAKDSSIYHDLFTLQLQMPIQIDYLGQALALLVSHHAVLRTHFDFTHYSEPLQLVEEDRTPDLELIDLSHLPEQQQQEFHARWQEAEKQRPFSWDKHPPVRFFIHVKGERAIDLSISFHHAILDGWSLASLTQEWIDNYFRLLDGTGLDASKPNPVSYSNFIGLELEAKKSAASQSFWQQRMAGLSPTRLLPWQAVGEATNNSNEERLSEVVITLPDGLSNLAKQAQVPLKTILLALHLKILSSLSHQVDVVTGLVSNGRMDDGEGDSLLGLFLNTLPISSTLTGSTWHELFHHVLRAEQEILPHRRFPLAAIQRLTGQDELFESVFNFVHFHIYREWENNQRDVTVTGAEFFEETNFPLLANFELDVAVDQITLTLRYDRNKFPVAQIQSMARSYRHLAGAVVADVHAEHDKVSIAADEDRPLILPLPELIAAPWQLIHQGVEQQVERKAAEAANKNSATNLIALRSNQQDMDYATLNQKANQLAHYLRERGVGPNLRVVVFLERGFELVISLLAILKAGGAYVPIDPSSPRQRLEFILDDAQAPILLTQQSLREKLPAALLNADSVRMEGRLVCVDEWAMFETYPQDNLQVAVTPEDTAYVIYTSGTTGKPKGVLIPHSNVSRLFSATREQFHFNDQDVWSLFHSCAFDFSVWELWGGLCHGGKVVIVDELVSRSSDKFYDLLSSEKVTVLNQTPSAFKQIIQQDQKRHDTSRLSLRYVIFGGEALHLPDLAPWFERHGDRAIQLINMYGITETTVHVTYKRIYQSDCDHTQSLIGLPINDLRVHILDPFKNPVPVGAMGEIHVAGAGVSPGYLNREALSAERFINNHLCDGGTSLYCSGDLARYWPMADNSQGDIEYLGRKDSQVKLRGFRIELGEIEAALKKHAGITDAVVAIHTANALTPDQHQQLVAFVVGKPGMNLVANNLQQYIQQHLPAYMVPAVYEFIAHIPLTQNGKVDRNKLLAVFTEAQTRTHVSHTTLQASTPLQNKSTLVAVLEPMPLSANSLERPLETLVIDVWKNVLDRTQINPGDNFFDIGGHSLLLIRVQEKLQELLGIEFSLVNLFNYPTVYALVNFLQPLYDAVRTTTTPDHDIGEAIVSAEIVQPDNQLDNSDIAIIGMSGRFPGANTVEEFWQNIRAGRDCIRHFNDDELREAGISGELIHSPDYVKANGAIDRADEFDAGFFGISHREAEIMDPQHRVFLECAWAALEDAGYCGDGHTDNIGVFAGSGSSTYMLEHLIANPQLLNSASEFQLMLGSDKDFLPSRVSYKLNLKGPSINVSTACSSSLVAVQVARQSLLNGECEIALAGGISIQGLGAGGYLYEKEGIASPDGRCRVFDKDAQGTVPGSGACIVILKKLDAAIRDNDFIHAVIKGAAINNDGFDKVGYTAPSIDGQKNVILQALGDLPASSIQYVEAHGTGTALGDPVEIEALNQAYKINAEIHQDNFIPGSQTCAIGSVKANIGHLDRAAGVAGLIKTVQALKAKQIPPNIHYQQANPQIPFVLGPFFVATEAQPWVVAPHQNRRRAAVSSFGIGGTNAHVILEEAPEPIIAKGAAKPQALITLSAKTPSALAAMSSNLEQYLRQHNDLSLADIAFTLNTGRKTFAHRKALVVSTVEELIHQLATGENVIEPAVRASIAQKTIFMFPGQGSHYAGVAKFLYETEAEFRSTIDYCAQQLLPLLGQDIRANLFNAHEESQNTAIAQPILFSLCFALAKQLMTWGIQPDAMLGHSLGEYVAACLAGVFTLDDALRLIAKRGQLMAAMPQGGMLAISIGEAEARRLLETADDLDLAAVNAANLVVVAGNNDAIDRFKQLLDKQDIAYQLLATSHAFHSRMMEPVLATYRDFLNTIPFKRPAIPFVSNFSGTWITSEQAINPDYWVSHLRNPVLFHQNLTTLLKQENVLLLEVGPGSQLGNLATRHPERGSNSIFSCLPIAAAKNTDAADPQYHHLLGTIAAFFCHGGKWDKQAFCRAASACRVSLPGYPFERQSYRLSNPVATNTSDTNTRALNTLNLNKNASSSSSSAISTHIDAEMKMPVADWFYEYRWKELDQTLRAKNESNIIQGQPILVLQAERDCHSLIRDLKTSLINAGHVLIQVFIGAAFTQTVSTQTQSYEFELDPRQKNHFEQLAACLSEQGILPGQIIHAWHLVNDQRKTSRSKKLPAKPLADSLAKGLFSLAYLTGSLQAIAPAHPFLLTLLTEGGQCITGEEQLRPEVAIDISALKVVAQEHPDIQCRSIDVRVKDLRGWQYQRIKDRLLEECCYPGSESELVVRGNRCWVPTISKATASLSAQRNPSLQPGLRQQGTYLITGGLGNIGLLIAQFLVQKVDANVVLLARTPFPEMEEWEDYLAEHRTDDPLAIKIQRLQAIQKIGGNLLILRGDVCNRKDMTQSLALIQARFGKLHGVFHGAAAPADKTFLSVTETTPEQAEAILAAKTQGVVVLDEVLATRQLDFCILLSSLASVLGGIGFYAYAGANGFMDRFAQQHNQQSEIPWLSLNMDGWNTPGVALNPALIDERDAVELFETIFGYLEKRDQQPQQLLISATALLPRVERSIGSGLHKMRAESNVQTSSPGHSTLHNRPATDTPYLAPRNDVETQLVQLWETYLNTVPIGVNDNIFSLGADSLLAIRFNAQIRSRYSLELSIRNIFEMPTIAALADFIATANNLQHQHGQDTEINSALEMEEGEI